jgi:hypothetical protein
MLQLPTPRYSQIPMWGARRGPKARAAALRSDAKLALSRLARLAHQESRAPEADLTDVSTHLDAARLRLGEYCAYLGRQLELSNGSFGSITGSYYRYFEQRQRAELAQLSALVARAPHSAGVAHGAYVTAAMLIGELEAQGHEFLVARAPVQA